MMSMIIVATVIMITTRRERISGPVTLLSSLETRPALFSRTSGFQSAINDVVDVNDETQRHLLVNVDVNGRPRFLLSSTAAADQSVLGPFVEPEFDVGMFIHSFIHSFFHSFIHSFFLSFIPLLLSISSSLKYSWSFRRSRVDIGVVVQQ